MCDIAPSCMYNLKDCVRCWSFHLDLDCQDAKQDNLDGCTCSVPADSSVFNLMPSGHLIDCRRDVKCQGADSHE